MALQLGLHCLQDKGLVARHLRSPRQLCCHLSSAHTFPWSVWKVVCLKTLVLLLSSLLPLSSEGPPPPSVPTSPGPRPRPHFTCPLFEAVPNFLPSLPFVYWAVHCRASLWAQISLLKATTCPWGSGTGKPLQLASPQARLHSPDLRRGRT